VAGLSLIKPDIQCHEETQSFLEKGKRKIRNRVSGKFFGIVSGKRGGDWGKTKCLISKNGRSKDFTPGSF